MKTNEVLCFFLNNKIALNCIQFKHKEETLIGDSLNKCDNTYPGMKDENIKMIIKHENYLKKTLKSERLK